MAIAAQREGTGTSEYGIWRVIMASSVGTMIEWYDFYIFGSLAAILSLKFYPPGHDTFALIAYLATFAVGFLVRPFRRAFLRAHRRRGRTQICLSRDPHHHGPLHVRHRPDAVLRDGRVVLAHRSDFDPRSARIGARRRIRRRCGLCGRKCS